MTKPKNLRTAASMILVTTALAWGLPVRAHDVRVLESEREGRSGGAHAQHQQDGGARTDVSDVRSDGARSEGDAI
ncbi:hypothetical protein [Pigmentiphaga sp.]|jgi:hypothetical protein|uniref:hypothetical protein n=1 Tax=Pigmentiphaga sp. TaxID=1977564 RepID=UPI0025E5C1DF|nr:hypothetical protein [Pigmentiphaga sp.]MBX6318876.1 hypothetical protein [Pigmentiphaga sp.]